MAENRSIPDSHDLMSDIRDAVLAETHQLQHDHPSIQGAYHEAVQHVILERARRAGSAEQSLAIASCYERLLQLTPTLVDSGPLTLTPGRGSRRKTSGAYFTPQVVIESMLNLALDPLIENAGENLLDLRICDPSAGAGHFLAAAARRIAEALARTRGTDEHALRDVVTCCLRGVDLNPVTAELCRITLAHLAGDIRLADGVLRKHIRCGDALLNVGNEQARQGIPDAAFSAPTRELRSVVNRVRATNRKSRAPLPRLEANTDRCRSVCDAWCAAFFQAIEDSTAPVITHDTLLALTSGSDMDPRLQSEIERICISRRVFQWNHEFEDVMGAGGFDLIIGNPPFLNQLEQTTVSSRQEAAFLRSRYAPHLSAYTDVAAIFLLLSSELVRPGGTVMLIQPQSLLGARDAFAVRHELLNRTTLRALWVANERVFEDASVYTCAPLLERDGARQQRTRRFRGRHFEELTPISLDMDRLRSDGTWAPLAAAALGIPEITIKSTTEVRDIAAATADFRDQYYGLRGFLVDDPDDELDDDAFPPILTSGLVDLATAEWGKRSTRILKETWQRPRVDRTRMRREGELDEWIEMRRVPKVIIATQTRGLEVFVDPDGRFIPSLPLITMTAAHPEDLWRLGAAMASPVATAFASRRYSGTALHADAIKLSASQTLTIPLPPPGPCWTEAARALEAAQAATDRATREHHLQEMAAAMNEAFGLSVDEADRLMLWWMGRHRFEAARSPHIASG